jgi:hypothetical protein
LVDAKSPDEVLYYGLGAGAVVLALAGFTYTSKKK